MQYMYVANDVYFFMDTQSYDQFEVQPDLVGDAVKYLKENNPVEILVHGTIPLGVELPIFVELAVTHTDPGLKGDTASGGTKPAVLETGATVQVPLFIEAGEVLKIDTRTDTYVERA